MRKEAMVIFLLLFNIFLFGCVAQCPPSCDDNNPCTKDYCSEETSFQCVHENIPNCCGNGICESENNETFLTCSSDCPNCDDNNPCTEDTFNYETQKCENVKTVFLTPIFEDDMESDMEKWNNVYNSTAWEILTIDSEGVLVGNFTSGKDVLPPYLYARGINAFKGNYSFSGKFKIVDGVAILLLRTTDPWNGYSVWIFENGVALIKAKGEGAPQLLKMSSTPISKNTWFSFKAVTIGNKILMFIENNKVIEYEDTNDTITNGNFGLSVMDTAFDKVYNSGTVYFDDVAISEVNETNYLC